MYVSAVCICMRYFKEVQHQRLQVGLMLMCIIVTCVEHTVQLEIESAHACHVVASIAIKAKHG